MFGAAYILDRKPRWVIPRGLHTTRNILVSSLIQWRSSWAQLAQCSFTWQAQSNYSAKATPEQYNIRNSTPCTWGRCVYRNVYSQRISGDCKHTVDHGLWIWTDVPWTTSEAVYLWTRQFITSHFLLIRSVISRNRKEVKRSPGLWHISASDEGVFVFNRTCEAIIMPNQDMPWQTSRRCQFMACSSYYPQFI